MNPASVSLRLLLAVSLAVLVITGCGGGGGGGGQSSGGGAGVLTYFTNFAAGSNGDSEVITLTDSAGTTVGTPKTINAPSTKNASTQQAVFSGLPTATVYVQAQLWTGPKGTGNVIGTAQTAVDGSTSSTMTTDVGKTAATVSVQPTQVTVQAPQTVPLTAEALDSSGNAVFENQMPQWSVTQGNGTIATVNGSGVVTGVGAGQATVQATYGSLTPASATVTVTAVTKQTWTIMVYLNASNSLDEYSYGNSSLGIQGNVPQMEQIAQTANSATRMVLQWKLSNNPYNSDPSGHPFNGTRRYLVTGNPNATSQNVLSSLQLVQDLKDTVDMGQAGSLSQFVQWAEKNYPAQHYALVVWDHGNGWEPAVANNLPKIRAISEDDETGNLIDVWQLGQALSGANLDILSFDACLMQMLEIENEVAADAHYMVCAEDNTPGPGYPYNTAFQRFFTDPTDTTTDLAKGIVDNTISYYAGYPGPVSQSVVDLTKTSSAVTALNSFSNALINSGNSIGSTVSTVRSGSIPYDSSDGYFYYDLGWISQHFTSNAPAPVIAAAQNLLTAEQAAVVYSKQNGLSSNSTGISIEFGNQPEFGPLSSAYANLKIASQTTWPTFLNSSTLNP